MNVSLASRLLLALSFVAALATALVGLSVRDAARSILERDHETRIVAATTGAAQALEWEVTLLSAQLGSLCQATFVDRVLVDLARAQGDPNELSPGSRAALRELVPAEAKARNLEELRLLARNGEVLGAQDPAETGTAQPKLAAAVVAGELDAAQFRDGKEPALIAGCVRRDDSDMLVGVVGARHIEPILKRLSETHGVELVALGADRESTKAPTDATVRTVDVASAKGLVVQASVSRAPLQTALASLDRSLRYAGGLAVVVAILLAVALARSLSQPLAALARETREVVSGDPRPVRSGGGKEIRQLADSFNRTIDELTAMRKRLAVTERIAARREVARQVAHEIKNPLAPIRAAVETLRRLRARDDPAFDEYFEEATTTVLQEVHRITNIVTEFTKFARMPAPALAMTDLAATAKGVVSLHDQAHTGQTGQPRARVELTVEDDVPEIRADRDQLIQVLTNLVQNGIDAATAERSDARVLVSISRQERDRVRIVVRDNGPGVPASFIPKLFEPYSTTKEHGTGLGLAIVQRIIFEHGGEITYRPATKGGAVFEIQLPVGGPAPLDKPLGDTTGRPQTRPGPSA